MAENLTQPDIRRFNWYIWRFIIGCFVLLALIIVITYLGVFGPLPSFRDLENPKSNLASEVISSDKQVLGTYYVQNRSNVTYKELSPNVVFSGLRGNARVTNLMVNGRKRIPHHYDPFFCKSCCQNACSATISRAM